MKLICHQCNTEIDQAAINLSEGYANCFSCNEFFKIADFLRDKEEITRIKKPDYSRIEMSEHNEEFRVVIPPAGWTGTAFFFLVFSLFWNGITWMSFLSAEGVGVFMIPFILIGILMVGLFVFMLDGTTEVLIDKDQVVVKWSMLGLNYTKVRAANNLIEISEGVLYTKNRAPVYGIELHFEGQGKVAFGSELKKTERLWLIGELYTIIDRQRLEEESPIGSSAYDEQFMRN